MKKVELAEAKAMLKEILAVKSASHTSIGTVLKIGRSYIDSKQLQGFGELEAPLKAVIEASQSAKNGVIMLDETVWKELENTYYERVTRHLFFQA